jgi:6,7-dimethyl-8-ribityllumazine synthase
MAEITDSKLLQTDTGMLKAQDACIVIVKTEWNNAVTDALEKGCVKSLSEAGVKNIKTLTVPGAFEISFGIKNHWERHKYKDDRPHAFIALGCVIRGDTPHFEYICKAVTEGVLQLNILLPIPTIFGVLTVDNRQQAEERTGGIHGHKGEEAAITALKMIALMKSS